MPYISILRRGLYDVGHGEEPGPVSGDEASALCHISCYRQLPLFADAATKRLFESSLETMRRRCDFFVTAYVVMPEHVHLLVSEPKLCLLSKAIQR